MDGAGATGVVQRDINRLLSQASVSSRDRLRTALDHREPDRIPLDFGGTVGDWRSRQLRGGVARLLWAGPGAGQGARALPDAGLVEDDLRAAMGLDVTGVFPRKTMFGFPADALERVEFPRPGGAGSRSISGPGRSRTATS